MCALVQLDSVLYANDVNMKKIIIVSSVALVAAVGILLFFLLSGADVPEEPDEALSNLSAAGYDDAKRVEGSGLSYLGIGGLVCRVSGSKLEPESEWIEIYYFKNDEAADEAWDILQRLAYSDFENPDSHGSPFVCEKSGSVIWFGTENAVSAANGD